VTEQSWAVAREWADAAKHALRRLPEGVVKDSLAAFADAVVERQA
jgi:heptaprenyl diphosphate synthase